MRSAIKRSIKQVGSVYDEKELLQFGGLNNRETPSHILDTQAADLMNVQFDQKESITKRNGFTSYAAGDANPIVSLMEYAKSSGVNYMIVSSGTSLFNVTGGAFVLITSTLTNGKRFSWATYEDNLYMVNGSDGIMKWDGLTFSTIGSLPFANAKYIVVHKNRLYITGDPANPSRVWFSDLGAPETVGGLSFIDINTNDGDVITGIAENLDSLITFKENSIHILRGTGPQNYLVLDSHQEHGTVSHWSIVNLLNKLYYLSRDGVYSFDGAKINLESDLIKGSVLGLNGNTAWNQQYLSLACGVQYKNKYYLALPEGVTTTNNRIYVLDHMHGYWTRYDIPASCFVMYPTNLTYQLYSGSTTIGKVYTQDTGTSDDGAAITAFFQTKDFDFDAPAHFKSFKGLFFSALEGNTQYSIDITYNEDRGVNTKTTQLNLGPVQSVWGTMLWGQNWGDFLRVVTKTTSVSGQARYLSFKVGDTSTNPWTFLCWIIRYKVKRRLS